MTIFDTIKYPIPDNATEASLAHLPQHFRAGVITKLLSCYTLYTIPEIYRIVIAEYEPPE